jgi:prepilin-type N-terminal cleavage/methylation domain-containing protein
MPRHRYTCSKRVNGGFTLIELLVVIAIVSALVAVAVPQYSAYKKRAFDVRAQMDLRSVALAEEAYFLDAERYLSCADTGCTVLPGIRALSPGVTLEITATTSGFTGKANHSKGSGKVYTWNSDTGGMQG